MWCLECIWNDIEHATHEGPRSVSKSISQDWIERLPQAASRSGKATTITEHDRQNDSQPFVQRYDQNRGIVIQYKLAATQTASVHSVKPESLAPPTTSTTSTLHGPTTSDSPSTESNPPRSETQQAAHKARYYRFGQDDDGDTVRDYLGEWMVETVTLTQIFEHCPETTDGLYMSLRSPFKGVSDLRFTIRKKDTDLYTTAVGEFLEEIDEGLEVHHRKGLKAHQSTRFKIILVPIRQNSETKGTNRIL